MVIKRAIILLLLLFFYSANLFAQEVSLGGKPKTIVTKEVATGPTTIYSKDDQIIELLKLILNELRVINTYNHIITREEINAEDINYKGETP